MSDRVTVVARFCIATAHTAVPRVRTVSRCKVFVGSAISLRK